MAQAANLVQLQPATLQAFEAYIREAEAAMEPTVGGEWPFLWSDSRPDVVQRIRKGAIVAELWSQGPIAVPDGLIHDWIGAAFAPHATLPATLARVQNYDNHKNIFRPEVMDSKLLSHEGNDFRIFLRLLKKKIITVVLDTEHEVHYLPLDSARCFCRSYTTRIAEVDDAGTPKEKVSPPDTGYGFLWRLDSYWRFQERDGGVYIECRAISLTRDIPLGLKWVIEPIIRKLPRESLINTLKATRDTVKTARD